MIVREILPEEKEQYNSVVKHPLQTWEWGEFREKTGVKVIRLGVFDPAAGSSLVAGYQVTIHPLPVVPYNIIYFPKGPKPDKLMLDSLLTLGQKNKAILVKLEPNVGQEDQETKKLLLENKCQPGRPLFTRFTFHLDLTQTEEELLEKMKPKTRYNVRLAEKHGVEVREENSEAGLEKFIDLHFETTSRQGFYSHSPNYYRQMRDKLAASGMEHVMIAYYQGQPLAAQIFFVHKNTLYYPYGASTRIHKEVMAPYALFWEAIKFGKRMGCTNFDMWGTPGPNPAPTDPWLGFHRFKEGFGAYLYEFTGTYDLVLEERLYKIYNLMNDLRWKVLRLKAKFVK